MSINDFAKEIARVESGRQQISIAQIKEVLKICNKLTGGLLYAIIKMLKR